MVEQSPPWWQIVMLVFAVVGPGALAIAWCEKIRARIINSRKDNQNGTSKQEAS